MTTIQTTHDRPTRPTLRDVDLIDNDRVVGWIAGDAVGFRGFDDETNAAHAAWLARRAIARRSRRPEDGRLRSLDVEPLALERRGNDEMILASGTPIARLVRPGSESRSGPETFGFELQFPKSGELTLGATAYSVYRALRKSGIRWKQ